MRPKFLIVLSFWFKKFPDSLPDPEFDLEWFLFVLPRPLKFDPILPTDLLTVLWQFEFNLQLNRPITALYCDVKVGKTTQNTYQFRPKQVM